MAEKKESRQLSPFEQKLNEWISKYLGRVPVMQKILFVSNLRTMVQAGLSLIEALRILSEQVENKKLKKTIGQIKDAVEKGQPFSEVLSKFPKIFPPIYVSMIAAGEAAGKLEEALDQVANQMKKNHELTAKIRGAMIYPAVIVVAMVGISIEIVFFVLPKLLDMFKEFNADLPLPTKILIAVVTFAQKNGIFILIGIVGLVIFVSWAIKQPKIKRAIHSFTLRLPIMGPIIKKINLARFTLTLASLLESTIPIIEATRIAAEVQTNKLYREHLLAVSEALKKGETLSEILSRYPKTFPPMVTQMIMVGEQSGKTEHMLKELADYYANEVDTTMKNFSTIIEPVIILVLGLAVAGIAVAVIMPMYSLSQSF